MIGYSWYITPKQYDIANKNGIGAELVTQRVRELAWSIERAITTPSQRNGKYKAWRELAAKNGICAKTFNSRVYIRGMNPQDAATIPVLTLEQRIEKMNDKKRIFSKNLKSLAEKNGISRWTFYDRIRRGWSQEDAATLPISEKYIKKGASRDKAKQS